MSLLEVQPQLTTAFHSVAKRRCPIQFWHRWLVPARCETGARIKISRHQSRYVLRFPVPTANKICLLSTVNHNSFSAETWALAWPRLFIYKWVPHVFYRNRYAVRPVPDFSLLASLPTWLYFQAVGIDHAVEGLRDPQVHSKSVLLPSWERENMSPLKT
jgi:hypothetical protein